MRELLQPHASLWRNLSWVVARLPGLHSRRSSMHNCTHPHVPEFVYPAPAGTNAVRADPVEAAAVVFAFGNRIGVALLVAGRAAAAGAVLTLAPSSAPLILATASLAMVWTDCSKTSMTESALSCCDRSC